MTQFPKLVAVRVDTATHKAFHDAARAKGLTASDLLRAAVTSAIASPATVVGVTGRAAA